MSEAKHAAPPFTKKRVALLNPLIDMVRDDEAHPLAGLMEIVGELIESYENTHYPQV